MIDFNNGSFGVGIHTYILYNPACGLKKGRV